MCFDAFGTLVEIGDRRGAFVPLFRALEPGARAALRHRLMREDRAVADWPAALGAEVPPGVVAEVAARVAAEVASVRLRPGMAAAWAALRGRGLRLGLCSNLAAPYGPAVLGALPGAPEAVALSFELGAIKPEPAIYAHVLGRLDLTPERVLFVGDTPRADIDGPRAAGLRALHVREFEEAMGRRE